ncbi:MAG: phosphatidylglycerophosphatase A family protein [Limisphaerales bacterium]
MDHARRRTTDKIAVFVAEGFGVGRIPFAPGTFGTALGLLWIYLLLLPRSVWIFAVGIVGGFFIAVWIGGRAEKVLNKKDPGSIVIDEITALPLAFLPAVLLTSTGATTLPASDYFSRRMILLPIMAFVLFRIFDIWKPLGIARVQNIGGGLGLVLDDFLAAIPAAAILLLYMKIAG